MGHHKWSELKHKREQEKMNQRNQENQMTKTAQATKSQRSELVTITPEMAKEWLVRNTHNRPVKLGLVEQLTKAILLGEWRVNGETIKFDYNGVLLDGQNRLHAIRSAAVAVESWVVFDLLPEAQETVDMGRRRSISDILALKGESNAIALGTTLNWIFRWENGDVRAKAENNPTSGQALALLDKYHDEIRSAIRLGQHVTGRVKLSLPLVAAAWFRFSQIDEDDCRNFWEGVTTGFYLDGSHVEMDSGPYALTRFLNREQNLGRGHRSPGYIRLGLIIKAWNAYRRGESVKQLSYRAGGSRPEPFPEPV